MTPIRKRFSLGIVGAAILSLALTACGGAGGSGPGGDTDSQGGAIDTSTATGEVSYWLWDTNQLPAYRACADAFHTKNPNVTVKISQYGYGDYWGKLTNGFVAGTAPDVFTNHLSKYPEMVTQEQLVPLDDTLKKDGIDLSIYQEGLADLWVGQDNKRYGLPKDFDTVALFYNKKLINDAGIDEASLQGLTWNPDDGGTYEKTIAHLTVDKNGKRGDEAGFDKTKVKVYGLGNDGSGGAYGQTQWSQYTGTLPWQVHRQEPVGHALQLRRPRLPEDHGLDGQPDREGLHALPRGDHRSELFRPVRRRPVRHPSRRRLGSRPDVQLQGRRYRARAHPRGSERQALQHVQRTG